MKYAKMLGLLAVAAAALMAFAGTASATTITSGTGTVATPTIEAKTVGHAILHAPIGTVECNGTVKGTVKTHGSGVTASGPISSLAFSNCTKHTVAVNKPGELIVHWTSGYNGQLTSTGAQVTVTDHAFGGTCIYETNATTIGTVTGGAPAKLNISATIPRVGGTLGAFCGASGSWTGTYETTAPAAGIFIDA